MQHPLSRSLFVLFVPLLTACQYLFPTPIDQHSEAGAPKRAVRTVGATFHEGEVLEAQLSLDGVAAGRGSLRVGKRCIADGKLALPIESEGGSSGLIKLLADAEADASALLDLDTNAPLESRWDITVADKRSQLEMDYRPGGYRVHQIKHEPDKDPKHLRRRVDLPIEQTPHDGHSFLGYVRRWEPADGTRGYLYVTMGRALYRADLVFVGKEPLQRAGGSDPAIRIDGVATRISDKTLKPQPRGERPFSLWISDDERRTPLRILIETEVTKISVDLLKYAKEAVPEGDPIACGERVDKKELERAKDKKDQKDKKAPEPKKATPTPGSEETQRLEAAKKLKTRILRRRADDDDD
jgi:hypothetical protein